MSLLVDHRVYTPQDINSELLLSQIPVDILQENIQKQFDEQFVYRKVDYVSSFITQYNYSKEVVKEMDDEDEMDALNVARDQFITFLSKLMEEKLDLGFPYLNDMTEEDQDELLHFTYRFFIVNIKHNFENLIINYIEKNKKEICETIPKKKDISAMSYKKEIEDPDDIIILSNLNDVIDYVLTREFTVDDFLNFTERDEPELEKYLVEDYYDKNYLVGNFLDKYFRMITRSFKVELECSVRNIILRKYIKYL